MIIKSDFTFFKASYGEPKAEGKRPWCRVTLVDDTHEVFNLFAASSSAQEVARAAQIVQYGERVYVTLDVKPNFQGNAYNVTVVDMVPTVGN